MSQKNIIVVFKFFFLFLFFCHNLLADRNETTITNISKFHAEKGDSLNNIGNKKEALNHYNKSLNSAINKKDSIRSFGSLAQIYYDLIKDSIALSCVNKLLFISPKNKRAKTLHSKIFTRNKLTYNLICIPDIPDYISIKYDSVGKPELIINNEDTTPCISILSDYYEIVSVKYDDKSGHEMDIVGLVISNRKNHQRFYFNFQSLDKYLSDYFSMVSLENIRNSLVKGSKIHLSCFSCDTLGSIFYLDVLKFFSIKKIKNFEIVLKYNSKGNLEEISNLCIDPEERESGLNPCITWSSNYNIVSVRYDDRKGHETDIIGLIVSDLKNQQRFYLNFCDWERLKECLSKKDITSIRASLFKSRKVYISCLACGVAKRVSFIDRIKFGLSQPISAVSVEAGFKYEWYLRSVENKVKRSWTPSINDPNLSVVLLFTIYKNGKISDIKITESSGNTSLDKLAIKAVKRAAPFGKLPPKWGHELTVEHKLVASKE